MKSAKKPGGSGTIRIGTAGWSIPSALSDAFDGGGSHLERYSRLMPAVEINSSFYRPHKFETYVRWAEATPDAFRFAVKLPKRITHVQRLIDAGPLIDAFAAQTKGLGKKLEVILVQIPPSLKFERSVAARFFQYMRETLDAALAFEPRHASWFAADAEELLVSHAIARVGADPPIVAGGNRPGGSPAFRYFRLHGSPRIYHSDYSAGSLEALAEDLRGNTASIQWCIFDNTASGAALANALSLKALQDLIR